jgi:RNA-binding protein
MLRLTPAERSALRSEAHALNPVVMIGEAGLTDPVLKEIDASLNAHGLIKVRVFGDDREERIGIYETICDKLDAAPIQHIGKLLVLYRPKKEESKERAGKKGKGIREVTIVKPSPSGTKRPTVTKVLLKGNERVTAGGSIKRAKPRQTSNKKIALSRSK